MLAGEGKNGAVSDKIDPDEAITKIFAMHLNCHQIRFQSTANTLTYA